MEVDIDFFAEKYILRLVFDAQYSWHETASILTVTALTLTHWGRVTHICVGKLTIIVSDNGLSPWRRQAIIWTNAGILLIGPLGTNFSEILIEIDTFLFMKMHLKMSSAKWRPFCLGLDVLTLLGELWQCYNCLKNAICLTADIAYYWHQLLFIIGILLISKNES